MVALQTPPFGPATPPFGALLPPPSAASGAGNSPPSLGGPAFAFLPSAVGGSECQQQYATKVITDRSGFAGRSNTLESIGSTGVGGSASTPITVANAGGNTQSLLSRGGGGFPSQPIAQRASPSSLPQKQQQSPVADSTTDDSKFPTPTAPLPSSSFASVTHAGTNRRVGAGQQFPSTPSAAPMYGPASAFLGDLLNPQASSSGPTAGGTPTGLMMSGGGGNNAGPSPTPPSTTVIERVADALPDNAPPPLSYAFRDGYGRLMCHAVATYYKLISSSEGGEGTAGAKGGKEKEKEGDASSARTTFVQFPESKRARAMAMVLPSMPFLQYLRMRTRNYSAGTTAATAAASSIGLSISQQQHQSGDVATAAMPRASPLHSYISNNSGRSPMPHMCLMVAENTMPPPMPYGDDAEDDNSVSTQQQQQQQGQGCAIDYTQCPAAMALVDGADADGFPLTKTAIKKLKKEIKAFERACLGLPPTDEAAGDEDAAAEHQRAKKKKNSSSKKSRGGKESHVDPETPTEH